MAYIARSNLVLSVTVTAITTMVAPLMTPFWMKLLAGTLVEVKFLNMMLEIVKIVIVPIGAALLHDYLKRASPSGRRTIWVFVAASLLWLMFLALGGWRWIEAQPNGAVATWLGLVGFLAGAVLAGVAYHRVTLSFPQVRS